MFIELIGWVCQHFGGSTKGTRGVLDLAAISKPQHGLSLRGVGLENQTDENQGEVYGYGANNSSFQRELIMALTTS